MVHADVPAILLTPICPHSLSTRPLCLPDSVSICIQVSPQARASASVSIDGRTRVQLDPGEYVTASISRHPLPCITHTDRIADWFLSLVHCLNWNERREQLPLSHSSRRPQSPFIHDASSPLLGPVSTDSHTPSSSPLSSSSSSSPSSSSSSTSSSSFSSPPPPPQQ